MGSLILSGLKVLKPTRCKIRPKLVHILLILRSLVVGSKDGWTRIEHSPLNASESVVNESSILGSPLQEVKHLLKSGIATRSFSTKPHKATPAIANTEVRNEKVAVPRFGGRLATEICERGYCRVDRDESCTRETPCEVNQSHSPTRLLQALIVLLKGWGWQAQQSGFSICPEPGPGARYLALSERWVICPAG